MRSWSLAQRSILSCGQTVKLLIGNGGVTDMLVALIDDGLVFSFDARFYQKHLWLHFFITFARFDWTITVDNWDVNHSDEYVYILKSFVVSVYSMSDVRVAENTACWNQWRILFLLLFRQWQNKILHWFVFHIQEKWAHKHLEPRTSCIGLLSAPVCSSTVVEWMFCTKWKPVVCPTRDSTCDKTFLFLAQHHLVFWSLFSNDYCACHALIWSMQWELYPWYGLRYGCIVCSWLKRILDVECVSG